MIVNDKAMEVAKYALQVLESSLNAGHSETLTNYLAFMGRFHQYSWNNVMLIMFQRGDATHVAGFQTWKRMGRYVKAGEKGIAIFVPLKVKCRVDQLDLLSVPERDEPDVRLVGFTTGHVFDIAQTDGQPLPNLTTVSGDPGQHLARIRDLYVEKGIDLQYVERLFGAKGQSEGGKVTILKGMSEPEEFAVLTHELAHELLHRGPRRDETDRRMRELEAEAVSFVVTTAIGLENVTASSDYIQLYNGDSKLLGQSLDFIQHVAAEILDFLV